MSAEEIQHLYEILDQKQVEQVEEQVLEGLRRLLCGLKEQITFYEERLDPEEYRDRPRDEKISLFGSDTTIGQILDSLTNTHWDSEQQLHEARSILAALALPPNYNLLDLHSHVLHAFYAIDNLLGGFRLRTDNLIAAYKAETAASRTPTQQAEDGSFSPAPSDTDSSKVQERPNSAAQDDRSSISDSPRSPYVKFMNKLDAELGARAAKMKKHEVKLHIQQRWDTGALGEPSAHKVEMMATMMRPPEAQKGRAKPKP